MDYFKRIIDFFTTGEFSQTGSRAFYRWLADEEHSDEKERGLKALWDRTDRRATSKTRHSWKSFRTKAGLQQTPRVLSPGAWKAAAAVLFIISLSSLYTAYRLHQNTASDNLVEQHVPVAERERLVLPDGSEVHLNSGSLLLYPGEFTGKNRSVYLAGEANFKVKEDRKKPFIVKSNDLQVTVLGTEFDVMAYPGDSLTRVTLLSGRVEAVYNGLETRAELSPSQQLVYNKVSGTSYIHRPDMEDVTAWQQGKIIFKGTTLAEVLTVLERKYPYRFVYNEEQFRNDTYTFRFNEDAPIQEVMEIIEEVVRYIRYRVVDDTCIIERAIP